MIDPVTGCFKITQSNNKTAMTIAKLVEATWMVRYPWPIEITYDQREEFLSHEFKIS